MLTVQKTFPLDFGYSGVTETVFAKAGDKDSRVLVITPNRFGSEWQLPDKTTARFSAKRSDGGRIYNDCELTDDGRIRITLTDAALAVPGRMICEIVLYGADGEICTSEPFTVNVAEGIAKTGYEIPGSESTAAENIIRKMNELYNELINTAGGALPLDDELSATSVHPVRNKVIKAAIDAKADAGHTHAEATANAAGFMSAADKTKLDALSESGELPVAAHNTLGVVKTTSEVSSPDGLTPCPIISGVPYYEASTPDSSMSDASENAVQNKVIKAYVDAVKSGIEAAITGGAW